MPLKSFTLHDLPLSERPRERLQKYGCENLSLAELLALILGRGVQGEPVMMSAQKLLAKFGSLTGIAQASLEDLQSIKGLGLAKACQLKALFEIARRQSQTENLELKTKNALVSPAKVYELLKSKIVNLHKEHFFVVSLDTRNNLLGVDCVSVGTLNANIVHPRETFESAIARHAAQIVIAHNHPSGQVEPSKDDIEVTKMMVEAGKILGIAVIDHLILGKDQYFSFDGKGLI